MKKLYLKTKIWILLSLSLGFISEAASAKALRFVYLQGFISCSLSNRAPAQYFLSVARNHPDARMYWGCFDGGFVEHAADWQEHFYLYTLESNGIWSQPRELSARSAPLEIALMLGRELESLEASAPDSDEKLMDLFIAGHSHGGWLAMRTAYQMGFYKRASLQQLLTVDPVSYELCHSAWFPVSALENTVRWWGEPHDCHRAPRDLEHLVPSIAAAAEYRWINMYENTMPYLSSGPIAGAPVNRLFNASSNFDWWTAHRAVLLDQSTWAQFNAALQKSAMSSVNPAQN